MTINFYPTKKTQRLTILFVCLFIVGGILLTWTPVHAFNLLEEAAKAVVQPFFWILALMGKLLVVLINIMLAFAQFNNFINTTAVEKGWVVVRDMCNVFLVLILLAISWGTVLRIESYHYKRTLPKFIIMAFLINFSKTIAGFFIDLCQVIMNTFVSRFADAAAANLTTSSGLQKVLQFAQETPSSSAVNIGEIFASVALGIFLILFMIGAVLMIMFILLGRIIVLWMLVVLSPLAYLGEMINPLKKAATQWWSTFGNYVTAGPIVAFFLWLAMAVMAANPGDAGHVIKQGIPEDTRAFVEAGEESGGLAATVSEMSTSDNLMSYFVTVGLLYAAVMAAQQTRTLGSGIGSKIAGGLAAGTATRLVSWPAKTAKGLASYGERKLYANTGIALPRPSRLVGAFKEWQEESKKKDEFKGQQKTRERILGRVDAGKGIGKIGLAQMALSTPRDFLDTYVGWKSVFKDRKIFKAAAGKDSELPTLRERLDEQRKEKMALENEVGQENLTRDQRKTTWEEVDNLQREHQTETSKAQAAAASGDADAKQKHEDEATRILRKMEALMRKAGSRQLVNGTTNDDDMRDMRARIVDAIAAKEKDIVNTTRQVSQMSPPRFYYAEQGRRAMENEEMKKVQTDNWKEIVAAMEDALGMGNERRFAALFRKATADGNDNEVLNHFGFSSNYEGAEEFRKKLLVGTLGMGGQESMTLMNDINYMNEKIGHWANTRMYGINKRGVYEYIGPEDHMREVSAEVSKRDAERFVRDSNRLAYGGEVNVTNDKGEITGREFRFDAHGLNNMATLFESWKAEMGTRKRANKNAASHFVNPTALKQLENLGKSDAIPTDKKGLFQEFLKELSEYGEAARRQESLRQSGSDYQVFRDAAEDL